MKTLLFLFLSTLFSIQIQSQFIANQNQVTIRDDRVILLNGVPWLPIGIVYEFENGY
jgi:hypothetical protein